MSNKPVIGLFGTCGDSVWRTPFMQAYTSRGIEFYNPQVKDWRPECAAEEAYHLANDAIILFPVTGETYGSGSLSEVGFSIVQAIKANPNRYVIVYIDSSLNQSLLYDKSESRKADPQMCAAAAESMRARRLVLAHLFQMQQPNVFVVSGLNEMLALSVKLYEAVVAIESARIFRLDDWRKKLSPTQWQQILCPSQVEEVVEIKEVRATCWNKPEPNGHEFGLPKYGYECTDHPAVTGTNYLQVAQLLGTSGCSKEEPYWDWSVLGVLETSKGKQIISPGDWIVENPSMHILTHAEFCATYPNHSQLKEQANV